MLIISNRIIPNDISIKIFSNLNMNNINTQKKILPILDLKYNAASRIKLFILIKLHYCSLRKLILIKLRNFYGIYKKKI